MPALTITLLKNLKRDTADRFIWDEAVKGFGVRLQASGNAAFVLKYRIGRKTKRYTIGKVGSPHTIETARQEARRLLRCLANGEDPQQAKVAERGELDVAGLAKLYLDEGKIWKPNKKPNSWATDKIVFNRHIVPLLGTVLASRVTSASVAKMQADIANGKTALMEKTRSRGLARVTGGRRIAALAIATLSGAYSFAVSTQLLQSNPCLGVARLKSPSRERFLSIDEVALLGESLIALETEKQINGEMAAAIRLLMFTGARKSEITTLKWNYVDWDRRLLRLPDSKTGPKVIPLAPPAVDLLKGRINAINEAEKAVRDAHTPALPRPIYVFPGAWGEGPTVGVPKAWRSVKEKANGIALERHLKNGGKADEAPTLSEVRLHDLRHTFASFAVADGASLYVLGKVLGHKDTRTTQVYAHLRDDPMLAVADQAAARVASALAGVTGNVVAFPKSA